MLVRRKQHEIPELNTTSTADISFMLLIFFLVTTSMDVDKGLLRQLPSPESKQKQQQETMVDKGNLMAIHLTAGDTLLVNDAPMPISKLKGETVNFVRRQGKQHLISIVSDRDADYDLYFQMQNQLAEAYDQLREEAAQKKYHKNYARLTGAQKEEVHKLCPQRITESYANAMAATADRRVDANAEEKQGEDKAAANDNEKGGQK